jgi:hypothetical protein
VLGNGTAAVKIHGGVEDGDGWSDAEGASRRRREESAGKEAPDHGALRLTRKRWATALAHRAGRHVRCVGRREHTTAAAVVFHDQAVALACRLS